MILTVSQLNSQIKKSLESNPDFRYVYVKGEITNFVSHHSGHLYFNLKDENSKIKVIMFSFYAKKLKINLANGIQVKIYGSLKLYDVDGSYHINCLSITIDGIGQYYALFEALKSKLFNEGLFSEDRKLKLPVYPFKIGILSAPTGAALQDIQITIKRRWHIAQLILFPCLVQGDSAVESIISQFLKADEEKLDLIIIARGGGSYEDLIAFNDENLARIVASAKTPTISAIGHEIDYTILDFVASCRAATPTAAAELATPNLVEVLATLGQLKHQLLKNIENKIYIENKRLSNIKSSYILADIGNVTNYHQLKLERKKEKLDLLSKIIIDNNFNKLEILKRKILVEIKRCFFDFKTKIEQKRILLDSLDANKILKRGYILATKNGKIITSISQINLGNELELNFADGTAQTKIIEKRGK